MSKTLKLTPELTEALDKLKKVGHGKLEVRVQDIDFVLSTLMRKEITQATLYASSIHEELSEDVDTGVLQDWLQITKLATLSYAIIGVNNVNLEDVEYIEAEASDSPSGVKKVQRHVFMRNLLQGWGDSVINVLFRKFNDLTTRVEGESEKGIKFDNVTDEERLAQLESEVSALRAQMGLPQMVEVGANPTSKEPVNVPDDVREQARQSVRQEVPVAPPVTKEEPPRPEPKLTETPEWQQQVQEENERLYQERLAKQNTAPSPPSQVINSTPPPSENPNLLQREQAPEKPFQSNPKPKGATNPNFFKP